MMRTRMMIGPERPAARVSPQHIRSGNYYGLAIAAASVLLLFGFGANYGNQTVFAVGILLSCVIAVSLWRSYSALRSVEVRWAASPTSHAGMSATVRLEVTNRSTRPITGLSIQIEPGSRINFSLQRSERRVIQFWTKSAERGYLHPLQILLVSSGPIHVLPIAAAMTLENMSVVAPAVSHLDLNGAITADPGSGWMSRSNRRNAFPLSSRSYRPGDALRSVNWQAVARGLPMMIRQGLPSSSARRAFDYAAVPSHLPAEVRLSILTRWIVEALDEGSSIALSLPRHQGIYPVAVDQRERVLSALAHADLS